MLDKDLFILRSQYHGSWRPDDVKSQGISNCDTCIYYVEPDQWGPRTLRVNVEPISSMAYEPIIKILPIYR